MPPSYPDKGVGFWGSPTSTLDWCEKNYVVTFYIAEFWNTISNVAFIVPAAISLVKAIDESLELRYIIAYALLTLVGVGSWAFHSTLLYTSQMLDELPMLFGACSFLYCIWTCNSKEGVRDWSALILTLAYPIFTSLVYLTVKEPLFHELCYSIVVCLLIYYSVRVMKKLGGSGRLYFISLSAYVIAISLWVTEVQLCPSVRHFRDLVWWPLKPATQLHAWWHLFTGAASYLHVLFSCQMRMQRLGYPCKLVSFGGCMPVLKAPPEWTRRKHY